MTQHNELPVAFATPPYPPPRRDLTRWITQYLELVRVALAEYRSTWFFHSFFGVILPIGMIFLFVAMGGPPDRERAIFLLGGNMATSIALGPTTMLVGKLGWGRQNREFDYWAALPVAKLMLVLALISVYTLFALPGVLASYLVGSSMLGLPYLGGVALALIAPLGALSLAGLGAFLGVYARDGQTANVLGNAMIAFITFLSPLMIPPEVLPAPLRIVAIFVPTTYVAEAFRAALSGDLGMTLLRDAVILAGFAIGFLAVLHYRLDWRGA